MRPVILRVMGEPYEAGDYKLTLYELYGGGPDIYEYVVAEYDTKRNETVLWSPGRLHVLAGPVRGDKRSTIIKELAEVEE